MGNLKEIRTLVLQHCGTLETDEAKRVFLPKPLSVSDAQLKVALNNNRWLIVVVYFTKSYFGTSQ